MCSSPSRPSPSVVSVFHNPPTTVALFVIFMNTQLNVLLSFLRFLETNFIFNALALPGGPVSINSSREKKAAVFFAQKADNRAASANYYPSPNTSPIIFHLLPSSTQANIASFSRLIDVSTSNVCALAGRNLSLPAGFASCFLAHVLIIT